jgi:hypothetical protein
MQFYNGPVPGDERPVGGGSYNKSKIGHEIYNFREANGRFYGYFQPTMSSQTVALERIDPRAADKNKLNSVLVVFVAPRAYGGQTIVGWYKDAEVHRKCVRSSPGKPRGFGYFCSAKRKNCILLPDENRILPIPFGKGGMGQANVCYPLATDGSEKRAAWMEHALHFIDDYQGSDAVATPEADAEQEIAAATEKALARSKGQGFARTPKERKAIENRAMEVAKRYFGKKGFDVEDVSARRPYDLLCRRGNAELHIEVKGTTTDGATIVLTKNEVRHARSGKNWCALFVLHSIRLKKQKASGGKKVILDPWRLRQEYLTPVSYTYRLS